MVILAGHMLNGLLNTPAYHFRRIIHQRFIKLIKVNLCRFDIGMVQE